MITVQLDVKNPYDGPTYRQRLKEMMYGTRLGIRYGSKRMSYKRASGLLDAELKEQGYDYIDDGWQIAVFDPEKIKIVGPVTDKPMKL